MGKSLIKSDKLCECGCGNLTNIYRGKPRRFIVGHAYNFRKGEHNPNWIGGEVIDSYGYVLVLRPKHPFSNNHGYVRKHRIVYEEYYKCCLLQYIKIHHKDSNRKNNSIDNLEPMTQSKHMSIHFKKNLSNRRCSICGSDKTIIRKDGYLNWYGDEVCGYKCKKCYDKIRKIKKRTLPL